MSLILEALRKMEQDRKNRQGASTGIRAEVLRYRASVQPQQAKPYLLVAACLLLLVAGIGAAVFLKGKGDVVASQETQSAALPSIAAPALTDPPSDAPALTTPPTDALPASVAVPATVTVPAPVVTAPAPAGTLPAAKPMPTNRLAASPVPTEPTAEKPARRPLAAEARAARAEADAKPQSKAARREPAEDVQPVMTDITISGIAYQDERNLRRAVLNGALVGEGAEVAGARVVEIKENKVRMSRGGQLFDVVFSSGFQSR